MPLEPFNIFNPTVAGNVKKASSVDYGKVLEDLLTTQNTARGPGQVVSQTMAFQPTPEMLKKLGVKVPKDAAEASRMVKELEPLVKSLQPDGTVATTKAAGRGSYWLSKIGGGGRKTLSGLWKNKELVGGNLLAAGMLIEYGMSKWIEGKKLSGRLEGQKALMAEMTNPEYIANEQILGMLSSQNEQKSAALAEMMSPGSQQGPRVQRISGTKTLIGGAGGGAGAEGEGSQEDLMAMLSRMGQ